jgi:hypothetical protein
MATLEGILALPPRPAIQKLPCYLATTGDVDLSATNAPLTVDGFPTYASARILVWQQSIVNENGLYVVQTASVAATGTLTFTTNPSDNDVVVIDAKTYTFKTVLSDVDGYVLIGGSIAASLQNLRDAIDLTGTPGTQYANSTTAHPTVSGTANDASTLTVAADTAGLSGNSIFTSSNVSGATWSGGNPGTLTGGEDGTWLRTSDWSDGEKDYLLAGASVYVQQGTLHAQKTFVITTTAGAPGFPTVGSFGFIFQDLTPAAGADADYLPYIQSLTAKTATFTGVIGETHLIDTSSGGFTCNLPAIASGQGRIGFYFTGTSGQLTLDPNASEQIEGKSQIKLQQGHNTIENDSGEWKLVQKSGRANTRLDATPGTTENNYSPTDWGRDITHLYLNPGATSTISGIEENGFVAMDSFLLVNNGTANIIIEHEGSGSTANNRIVIEGGRSVVLQPDGIVEIIRDGVANQWRMKLPGRIELRSDTTQTSGISTGTFNNSQSTADYTGTIDVNDYDDVDVFVEVLTVSTISEFTVFAESSGKAAPASDEWAVMQSDDAIVGGAVDLGDYLAKELNPVADGWFHWNFPARGATMRFGIFADQNAGTYNLFYKRNVRRG